ncbi:sugar phosphate isomerase/epimerase [Phenylobacterium sp.]|uniref:sugar phosphate isomerase/epimerase family protein n=1 Tax=Phenylobacterium sp. TaxID=1871053 RepID=UPI0027350CCE|nr:sugar phosphate isomerase/epimerase [Phenylobacterium sp.]MDP3852478.1 sugar phosphate isomerase/epimerase [Phenylobacterium sp.]
MRPISPQFHRRGFLGAGLASMAATAVAAAPQPFFKRHGLPLGIQLYTLGPDAAKDLDGTLKSIAAIGYKAVELPGLTGRAPADIRAALDRAGLVCTSAHIQARGEAGFEGDLARLADALATIGVTYAVAPSPYAPDHAVQAAQGLTGAEFYRKVTASLTADDWKMNADFLNAKGAALKSSGIGVGYHNHNFEFAPLGDTNGLEILLKNTDPKLVTFEIDVGWVAAAGADPLALLRKHKGRFTLMHVKDIKATTKPNYALTMDPTEIGSGSLDWAKLLPAAYASGVRGFYVEQEPPFTRPRIEAAKISHDYLARVNG